MLFTSSELALALGAIAATIFWHVLSLLNRSHSPITRDIDDRPQVCDLKPSLILPASTPIDSSLVPKPSLTPASNTPIDQSHAPKPSQTTTSNVEPPIDQSLINDLVQATAVNDANGVFMALFRLHAVSNNYDKFFALAAAKNLDVNLLLSNAKLDHMWCSDFVISALSHGVSPDIKLSIDGIKLPLPCYLARSGRLDLLLKLLDDKVMTMSACGVVSDDMWRHFSVKEADIPIMCAIMEHFGPSLLGSCSIDLRHWLESNRMLLRPLTAELTRAYPHLARAVVDVTPFNSQAVTIAVKRGFVDWLKIHIVRLRDELPHGYRSWRAMGEHLKATGADNTALVYVCAMACMSEPVPDYIQREIGRGLSKGWECVYLGDATVENVPKMCANLEELGPGIEQYSQQVAAWINPDVRAAFVAELCKDAYKHTARMFVTACRSSVDSLPVAVHHGFTECIAEHFSDGAHVLASVQYLCSLDASVARSVVEKCTHIWQCFKVAVHFKFTDLYSVFTKDENAINDLLSIPPGLARPVVEACLDNPPVIRVAAQIYMPEAVATMLERNADGVVKYLCSIPPYQAVTVVTHFRKHIEFIPVAVHHNITNLLSGYLREHTDAVIEELCRCDAKIAKAVLSKFSVHPRLLSVALRHGFIDHVSAFINNNRYVMPPLPTPPNRAKVSDDQVLNAWLWYLIGNSDVDSRTWAAIDAAELVDSETSAARMVVGVFGICRKVTGDAAIKITEKYPTVLVEAIKLKSSLDVARCLVDAGADVNARDNTGSTVLHYVSDAFVAQYLIDNSADINIANNVGRTADANDVIARLRMYGTIGTAGISS